VWAIAAAGVVAAGCGDDEEPRRAPQVAGSGFSTERPKGFSGVGTGAVTGVVLSLTGPLDRSAGSAPSVTVGRSPVPPDTTPGSLRKLVRAQTEAQGPRKLVQLPARRIGGEPAAGVRFRATASNRSQTIRRTYAVRHRGFVYTIGSTVPARSAREAPIETVLDKWRWTP
jgi:hypothetical protein